MVSRLVMVGMQTASSNPGPESDFRDPDLGYTAVPLTPPISSCLVSELRPRSPFSDIIRLHSYLCLHSLTSFLLLSVLRYSPSPSLPVFILCYGLRHV